MMLRGSGWGALCLLLAALPSGGLGAQGMVQGVVRDSASGVTLDLVDVAVEAARQQAVTDSSGRYALPLAAGDHVIRFRRIGYAPAVHRVSLAGADTVRLDVMLVAAPQELEAVTVEAPTPPRAWPPGLDQRIRDGAGSFLTGEVLRRSEHRQLSSLLRSGVRGVRVVVDPRTGRSLAMGRGASCPMAIWLNGHLVYRPSMQETSPDPSARILQRGGAVRAQPGDQQAPPDLDQWKVSDLEAVEVYSVAQTPIQYAITGGGCGTILLWTRVK
jgi:hypothetical protein